MGNGKSETLNHGEQKEEDGFLPQIYADIRRLRKKWGTVSVVSFQWFRGQQERKD